ncbi:MAG: hypothetical protein ABSF83_03470 [Nitrososphaerales archaeon]
MSPDAVPARKAHTHLRDRGASAKTKAKYPFQYVALLEGVTVARSKTRAGLDERLKKMGVSRNKVRIARTRLKFVF